MTGVLVLVIIFVRILAREYLLFSFIVGARLLVWAGLHSLHKDPALTEGVTLTEVAWTVLVEDPLAFAVDVPLLSFDRVDVASALVAVSATTVVALQSQRSSSYCGVLRSSHRSSRW